MHKILLFGLWPIFFLPMALPSVAANLYDRVQTPSLVTEAASRVLLLDLVKVPESNRLIAVGEQGSILYSDDEGINWQQAKAPVSVLLAAVQMVSSRQGWAVGHDGVVLHTGDGGLSWQIRQAGQDLLQVQLDALAAAAEIAGSNGDSQLQEELEWQLEDTEVALDEGAMPTLLDLYFLDEQKGFVAGAYGRIFYTADAGRTWSSLGHSLPNPDRLHLNALQLTREGRLMIAGEAGLLVYSDDLGRSWEAADSPYEGSFFALAESDRLYLLGLRGHLFSSADGIEWQAEPLSTEATLNSAVISADQLFLLGQGGVLVQKVHSGFQVLPEATRNSYAAGVQLGNQLLLAGEGGVTRINLAEQGGAQ